MAEVESVEGEVGHFSVSVIQHPRYIDVDKCIACGKCAEKCPKKVVDEYNAGLDQRKAAYVKFSQAVPLKYAIDADNCIYLQKGKCRACEKFCPADAVNFEDKEKKLTLDVGAIVLALGSECYDPADFDTFGYQRLPGVLTSLEFERMLSASGPFMGHLKRLTDGESPQKIAWLQCVGSRALHPGAGEHCSAVCCSYAIKEAIIAKEHAHGELDAAVFFIDMRTHGKDVERYYNRAQDLGVRFVKSRISALQPSEDGNCVLLHYTDAAGRLIKEEFDLVVLSVGYRISPAVKAQMEKFGIELRADDFPVMDSFAPVKTSRPGVFLAGTMQAPKDIPFSVIDASACAGMAGGILAESRRELTHVKENPPEINVVGEPPRIGVFVCNCGSNIAGVVDCPGLAQYASTLPGVAHVEENLFSCSQDTQEKMAKVIAEKGLNRVVVAACTPRTHEPLFQETLANAGLNKYLFEMANIRNQCSWVHADDHEAATQKAKDLVRMSVAKAGLLSPLKESELEISRVALVVGGGLAGLSAALNLADQGFETFIVEKESALGGNARFLQRTWQGEDVQENLARLIQEVEQNPRVKVFLNSAVTQVEGFVGNFKTTVETGREQQVLEHGAVIIACGASEFQTTEYMHGQDPRVITSQELERRIMAGDAALEQDGPVVFLQCVGSRIPERPYCSKVCCTHSIMSALRLKELNPEREIYIVHRDIRTYGLREGLYRQAREKGIHFIRYDVAQEFTVENGGDRLDIGLFDWVLQRRLLIKADLLVLASAVVPPAENPLAQMFKITLNQDGFFQEAHAKLKPVDFATDGVFVCGLAHSPQPVEEAVAQGQAAAARAGALLSSIALKVGGSVSVIDQSRCVGCGVCVATCPYQAITLDENGKAVVNAATCKGCGSCVPACRSGAPTLEGFSEAAIMAQLGAMW